MARFFLLLTTVLALLVAVQAALYWAFGVYGVLAGCAALVALLWLGWRQMKAHAAQGEEDEVELVSMVLFLKSPRLLSQGEVESAAARVFGAEDLQVVEMAFTPEMIRAALGTDTAREAGLQRMPLAYGIVKNGVRFSVACSERPYFPPDAEWSGEPLDENTKEICRSHQANIMVDYHSSGEPMEEEEAMRHIGHLLADIADARTMALYTPTYDRVVAWSPEVHEKLRGDDPRAAFGPGPYFHPGHAIRHIPGDNPELVAAVEQARRRWPEFVEAFRDSPDGREFFIKAPFEDACGSEFMWVRVSGITDESVAGELVNEPATVESVKLGDTVTVPLAHLNDWMIMCGDERTGGFTIDVLMASGH